MRKPTRSRLLALAGAAAGLIAAGTGLGCATPTPPWPVAEAERQLAAGRPVLALHYSEEAIQAGYASPSAEAVAVHARALRALGRDAEADAFLDFTRRYDAGEDTYARDTDPPWSHCIRPRSESDVSGFWKYRGLYPVDTLAAAFRVQEDGRVDRIRVLRARHPGAAWLMIELVGEAFVPPARLQDFRDDPDVSFPLDLCVWLDSRWM